MLWKVLIISQCARSILTFKPLTGVLNHFKVVNDSTWRSHQKRTVSYYRFQHIISPSTVPHPRSKVARTVQEMPFSYGAQPVILLYPIRRTESKGLGNSIRLVDMPRENTYFGMYQEPWRRWSFRNCRRDWLNSPHNLLSVTYLTIVHTKISKTQIESQPELRYTFGLVLFPRNKYPTSTLKHWHEWVILYR